MCLLALSMKKPVLQSFVEQRHLSLTDKPERRLLGGLFDLYWILQDRLHFCNITFPFLMVPERGFQQERSMTCPVLS